MQAKRGLEYGKQIPVEAVGAVELLAAVLVGLHAGVVVGIGYAVGIVAIALHHVAVSG